MNQLVDRSATRQSTTARQIPSHFWAGVLLIAAAWTDAWTGISPLSSLYFFPLWLGYILTVDSLVVIRTGTSPVARSGWRVAGLFLLSIPFWWLFELFNERIQNWNYHMTSDHSSLSYVLRSTIAFTTVVPAILTTAELVRSFRISPPGFLPALRFDRKGLVLLHLSGWAMLALMLIWPEYGFPLCWISVLFIIDPLVGLLGGRSLADEVRNGDWSVVINLAIAGLICGFFWEFWNSQAMPKWTYTVPHVGFLKVFEMPLLGYGGYIPFALELFAIYNLARRLLPTGPWPYVRIGRSEEIDPASGRNL